MRRIIALLTALICLSTPVFAQGAGDPNWFEQFVEWLGGILFQDALFGAVDGVSVPIIVLWLVIGAVFFTIRMGFINIRGFKHALDLVRGKYDNPDLGTIEVETVLRDEYGDELDAQVTDDHTKTAVQQGEVSHFQALTTALSATVGLGNIAGVAVAITLGGPGATFWMITAGLLGMSSKFVECTLGVKYRKIDDRGDVSGGPMYYLSRGLGKRGMGGFGKVLAVMFAVMCVLGSFGGGNMFQANQAFAQFQDVFGLGDDASWIFGFVMALVVGVVIIGGIKSIAKVTDKIVPFMCGIYVLFALIIIGMNITRIGEVFGLIFSSAFTMEAGIGGIVGVMIQGFKRAAFSNEAGVGSASIAHSASKTDEPVSEGIVALLEPFIDTVVVCTMTALVLIFTGFADGTSGLTGVQLTSAAFTSIFSWFNYVLVLAIVLFAFSTMVSWSYYGMKAWSYLFGGSRTAEIVYKIIFLAFVIVGCISDLGAVIDFSDMMILAMAFPNIIGLYIMSGEVATDLKSYLSRIRSGEIKAYK